MSSHLFLVILSLYVLINRHCLNHFSLNIVLYLPIMQIFSTNLDTPLSLLANLMKVKNHLQTGRFSNVCILTAYLRKH